MPQFLLRRLFRKSQSHRPLRGTLRRQPGFGTPPTLVGWELTAWTNFDLAWSVSNKARSTIRFWTEAITIPRLPPLAFFIVTPFCGSNSNSPVRKRRWIFLMLLIESRSNSSIHDLVSKDVDLKPLDLIFRHAEYSVFCSVAFLNSRPTFVLSGRRHRKASPYL